MAAYELVIKNGTIVDGTGLPRYIADIGIRNGVIARIGRIPLDQAESVIDAEGMIVAPGAIDSHTHFDTQIHWDPYCTPHSWHGYTTVVATNCGFGFAPCRPDMRDRYMKMMEATEQVNFAAAKAALPWDWETYPEWMAHMRSIPKGINLAQYFPLNPALCYVMGVDDAKKRAATRTEMTQLKDLLNRAMDAGAIGFSLVHLLDTSSHTDFDGSPMPTDIHPPEDFYKLADVLRERDQGMVQALVDLPGVSTRFVAEELARSARRPILHNTVGPYEDQPEFHRGIMAWLDKCEAEGLDIYSFSPGRPNAAAEFAFHDNNLIEAVPYFRPFSRSSREEKTRMAADPAFVEGARAAYDPVALGSQGLTFDTMRLSNAASAQRYTRYEGATIQEIAAAEGQDIVSTLFSILAESRVDAEFRTYFFGEMVEELREVVHHPRVVIGGTDGGAHLRLTTAGDSPERDHRDDGAGTWAHDAGASSLQNELPAGPRVRLCRSWRAAGRQGGRRHDL